MQSTGERSLVYMPRLILAPLRGVTIRAFRTVFADQIAEAGFDEVITPFIAAAHGLNPLKDREIAGCRPSDGPAGSMRTTPQLIGKDPVALREALLKLRDAGFETADLNCGCPFPMVRNKGRGSGLLRTPDVLARMIEAGCETMGEGRFSVKARLGVERTDELLKLMPVINGFPLRFLAVHARTAKQMYEGACDWESYGRVVEAAKMQVVPNGDLPCPVAEKGGEASAPRMVGRPFIRSLGQREDVGELLSRYIEYSMDELKSQRAVLGRVKELVAYWRETPRWRRRWDVVKIARSLDELALALR
ncbi:MAG: tRNA-dihydrouridine synthase family protein [Lentisphaerae bacterium]|nr:tRNA-dihydrouridine synthase family protein [Lentisphaerota bacterium]